ncbi:hypothetical protein QBZ16_001793 [Prototheca wickerhamii]|uniref:ribonuclease Z n=1 Tax=Prototheca wickerhamii TaxID=3111 RepID=A0AAD9IEQ9_PROWI|nr:hypothetical protein QBZ16_001793 [Prototheca wickerhamii]
MLLARAYRAITDADAAARQLRGTELFIGDCAGSGKTLAYLLPLLDAIEGRDSGARPLQGLVIVPSPELARQAVGLLRRLRARGDFPLQTIGLTTGSETPSQRAQLLAGADVAVGTPQRLAALMQEGRLDVGAVRAVALDEVDVLLGDESLAGPTRCLLDAAPSSALRVAASASLPPALAAALRALWPGVQTVAGPRLHLPAPAALRGARVLDCSDSAASIGAPGLKAAALARLLAREGTGADPLSPWTRALVFVNKIGTCRELEAFLTHRDRRQRLPKGTRTLGFHAATPPHLRKAHLKLFVGTGDQGDPAVVGAQGSGIAEQGKSSPAPVVLVATDRAARGLDTVGIDHVILFDLPRDPSEFLRRVGRAARGPHRGRCRVTVLTIKTIVQILGTGGDAPSTAPSVLLFFDRQRYLFNMGEGYQRYCVERRLKLSRISALLLTRAGAATTGGLPGALLTMADSSAGGLLAGQAGLTVHGPRGLGDLVNAYRTFVNLKDLGLRLDEYEDACARPAIANELVTITPVLVEGNGKEEAAEKEAAEPDAKRVRVDEASTGANSPPTSSPDVAVSYIAELPAVPGKFLPQRAAALGVPRGPAYGRLVRGESVTATSGAVVTPEDVMEPGTPGPAVLVVDCPTAAHLNSLVAAPALRAWATDAEKSARLQLVVHLAPAEVVRAPAYAAWAAGFPPTATHVLAALAPRRGLPVMRSAAAMQVKLHALAPTVFPLQRTLTDAEAEEPALPEFGGAVVSGRDMLRFHLRPVAKRGLDSAEVPAPLSAEAIAAELRSGDTAVGAALMGLENGNGEIIDTSSAEATAKPTATPPACLASSGRRNLEITFLGTGAAIPSKYRNVTGTLVDLFDHGALLVDCGEGSLGQLERSLGEEACAALLRRLRAVWISHVHADHHVGLLSVLSARQAALKSLDPAQTHDPLIVIAPRTLRRAIAVYASLLPGSDAAALAALREAMGLTQLRSLAVEHCAQAYGLVLERASVDAELASSNGNTGNTTPTPSPPFKVVFSGDTRPCEAVVAAAEGATLLVHEATFEDELADEAEAKNHCTTTEAIGVAARAGAFRTILTHFSQRYPKIPVIDVNFQDFIAIAFDLMRVNLVDLPDLPKLVPKLKILFAEGEDGEDGATAA